MGFVTAVISSCESGAGPGISHGTYYLSLRICFVFCFMCVGVLPALCLCAMCTQYLPRPEKGFRSPGTGVTAPTCLMPYFIFYYVINSTDWHSWPGSPKVWNPIRGPSCCSVVWQKGELAGTSQKKSAQSLLRSPVIHKAGSLKAFS